MSEEIACTKQRKGHGARPRTTPSTPRQHWLMDIDTIIGACQSIATEIERKGIDIDVLYPASRDAFIPARLVAMYLRGPRVTSMRPEHLMSRCKVLIVDDVSYTGNTLRSAARRFEENGHEATTACVVMGEDCTFEPGFHAIACSSGSRVVFPWQEEYLTRLTVGEEK